MNLAEWIINHEKAIRMASFFSILAVMALWEVYAPRRALTLSKSIRWLNNLGLVFFNSFIVWLILPATAVGVTLYVQQQAWGLFNNADVPGWLAIVGSVVILDLIIYLQHVMVHAIPVLWRLHRVHHADLDYDVTTGSRFHPAEILLSMLIKFTAIVLLGPPVLAVIVFEIILSTAAMFNHSNVRIPLPIDRVLRWFIVTPDMHRVHHSVEDDETNSNFGFNLPWWDRLFGTYLAQPRAGHENMTLGIRSLRKPKQVVWLPGLLAIPFIGKIGGYAINRRRWEDETK